MVVNQKRSNRKPSGARYKSNSLHRRLHQKGGLEALTSIGTRRVTTQRTKGGQHKNSLLKAEVVLVFDKSTKKVVKAKIASVAANPANRNYVRRNILTLGTIVNTDIGKVKITNRPGQEAVLNGVQVE